MNGYSLTGADSACQGKKTEVFPAETGVIRAVCGGLSAFVRVSLSGLHQKKRNKCQKNYIQILTEERCKAALVFFRKKQHIILPLVDQKFSSFSSVHNILSCQHDNGGILCGAYT